jgi:hypothetical protein
VLQRLNPLSAVLARLWSLFVPVRYWRAEYVSPRRLARFDVLDPADYFTVEEWHRAMEGAYLAYRVDHASPTLQQWRALQFEERYLFDEMARRASPDAMRAGAGFALLDWIWLGALALGKTVRQALALFRCEGSTDAAPCRIFWTDISAGEVASVDQRLSFCFAVERGLVDPGECLYFLAVPPSPAAADRLRRLGVRWTTVGAFGFLPVAAKLKTLAKLLGSVASGSFVRWRHAAEAAPWVAAARALGCRTYLTSVSSAWPEPSQVEALRAKGVRTVNWSYGANTFCFSVADESFRDLGLLRSVSAASEVWVWTDAVEAWLRRRSLAAPPTIREIGPVMSGDSRWLARTPAAARLAYGIAESSSRRYVAVFDVPPVNREMRLAIGHGPTVYPAAMLEQFFRDLEGLLRLPEVTLIVKPKRSLQDTRREFADSMHELLASGRVIALPHDIDPYIPVALADVCIGVPFTSPVIAGLYSGRGGLFHDPRGEVVRVPGAPALMGHVTHGVAELHDQVARLLGVGFKSLAQVDPGERFAAALNA